MLHGIACPRRRTAPDWDHFGDEYADNIDGELENNEAKSQKAQFMVLRNLTSITEHNATRCQLHGTAQVTY